MKRGGCFYKTVGFADALMTQSFPACARGRIELSFTENGEICVWSRLGVSQLDFKRGKSCRQPANGVRVAVGV